MNDPQRLLHLVFGSEGAWVGSATRVLACSRNYVQQLASGRRKLTKRHLAVMAAYAQNRRQTGLDWEAEEVKHRWINAQRVRRQQMAEAVSLITSYSRNAP